MEDSDQKTQSTTSENNTENPGRTRVGFPQPKKEKNKGKGTLIFIILAILALVLVGFWLVFGKGKGVEEMEEGMLTPSVFEEDSFSPSPIPTQVEFDRDEISIQILNGSGISGAAGDLSDKMEDLGYSDIEVGNASNQDYETTNVTFSSSLPDEVVDEITEMLEDMYEDVDSETGSTDEYDIEIITGYPKDYSPTPTEKPSATNTPTPTSSVTATVTPTSSPTPTP
jgi:hypothetical protein